MPHYRKKLLEKIIDRIIADVEMDIPQHIEALFAKLIQSEENRKAIEEYLAE